MNEIPQVPLDADGMIVRLSKLQRQQILGLTDGKKIAIPSLSQREGTKIIFLVALEEGMPDREECLKIKKLGLLLGIAVSESDINALDSKVCDYIGYDVINMKNNNQLSFMVEIRRQEDLEENKIFKVGDVVILSPDNNNENYDSIRKKKLRVVNVSKDKTGKRLYILKTLEGEVIEFYLQSHELEGADEK